MRRRARELPNSTNFKLIVTRNCCTGTIYRSSFMRCFKHGSKHDAIVACLYISVWFLFSKTFAILRAAINGARLCAQALCHRPVVAARAPHGPANGREAFRVAWTLRY